MKKLVVLTVLAILALSACVPLEDAAVVGSETQAPRIPEFTTENRWVIDVTETLSDEEIEDLNRTINAYERESGVEIAILMIKNCPDPQQYRNEVFNTWKLGKADKDNGLLILIVMDKRRTEVETGYGLEPVLPDVLVVRLQEQVSNPKFKEEKYGEGLLALVNSYIDTIEGKALEEVAKEDISIPTWVIIIIVVIAVLILLVIVATIGGEGYSSSSSGGWSSGGSGGGGSSGGGGGGSSGGGGGGSSW